MSPVIYENEPKVAKWNPLTEGNYQESIRNILHLEAQDAVTTEFTDSTSSADQHQEAALSVFERSLAAGSTFLTGKWRAGSNCNLSPDLICSGSQ